VDQARVVLEDWAPGGDRKVSGPRNMVLGRNL